jgi:pyruvate dehydrogenase complex dehydrogenase (E1) component
MSSFASSATIYEVCYNHFFRARNEKDGGDLVYFRVTSPRASTPVHSPKVA